jgi:hypothetical protein
LTGPLAGISIANVAASWHSYDFNGPAGCPNQYNGYTGNCNSGVQTAAAAGILGVLDAGFPFVLGETGISAYDSSSAFVFSPTQLGDLQTWLDGELTFVESAGQGYLAWDWNTSGSPFLITDYDGGVPTPYFGVTYQAHLASF